MRLSPARLVINGLLYEITLIPLFQGSRVALTFILYKQCMCCSSMQSLRRYETSKAKLEGQERALTAQLQKQLKQNEDLRQKG